MSAELDELLLSIYPEPDEIPEDDEQQAEVRERFRIRDDSQATWALRKIRKIRKQVESKRALAQAEIERINAWLESELRRLEREEKFFEGLLAEYHLGLLQEDPSHKTHRLPGGRLQYRSQPPEYQRDEAKLLSWLKERQMTEYIEVIEKPRWSELKKAVKVAGAHVVTDDGDVVDGVVAIERPPKFSVILDSDGGDNK